MSANKEEKKEIKVVDFGKYYVFQATIVEVLI